MVVLNWASSVGNRTLSTSKGIQVPFQTGLASLKPSPVPAVNVAQPDEYGIYFLVQNIDPDGEVTFKTDADGFKIPYGYTSYQTTNIASPPGATDDFLIAIGYPPGILSEIYINAFSLTTIRLGDGNDVFKLGGAGITQSLSAAVSKEASQGYIFQSNIFADAGDDNVQALMPFQSVFKGGSNTVYFDEVFTPNASGVGVILSDSLTLEEVPFGDTIELKGSRFDWDIEFKDGNNDGSVTLASIIDGTDYIATSNNNQISAFERILFGDILFDLILYRQQESSAIYGNPDYFLTGSEPQAPELNSDIASGSQLWEGCRFNRTKLQGISGTATNFTDVFTGNANDTPFLVGALKFASLNTETGIDIAEIGSADQATFDLGEGNDSMNVKGLFSKSTGSGGLGNDNIIIDKLANSRINGGGGDDVVEIVTSSSNSFFDGGDGTADVIVLGGQESSFGFRYETNADTGVVTLKDNFFNTYTGFEGFTFIDNSYSLPDFLAAIDTNFAPSLEDAPSTSDGGLVISPGQDAGPVSINGTSNGDVIVGSNGDNQIYGGLGADILTGLLGVDQFRFRLSEGLGQGDQITDFNPVDDKIQLADVLRSSKLAKLFKGQAVISENRSSKIFAVVDSAASAESSKRLFVYDRISGSLYYNEDSKKSGFGVGGEIAKLPILVDFQATDISLLYSDQVF